jgi:hypothetical protein
MVERWVMYYFQGVLKGGEEEEDERVVVSGAVSRRLWGQFYTRNILVLETSKSPSMVLDIKHKTAN